MLEALKRRQELFGGALLVAVTFLWGTTFVVIKGAVEQLAPSVLLAVRFGIGAAAFIPWLKADERLWRGGLELSFWLWLGYATQTLGLQTTTASRSAFITSLSVILVPVFLRFVGRRTGLMVWISAVAAIVGVGLLSHDGGSPVTGDLWTLGTAVTYAIYLIRAEKMARAFDALPLAGVQITGVFALSLLWVGVEQPTRIDIPWLALLYLGVVCTSVSIVLQMRAQRTLSAPRAAVIFTLEPVWAALMAFIVLDERLQAQGWVGALLILAATVAGQRAETGEPDPRASS